MKSKQIHRILSFFDDVFRFVFIYFFYIINFVISYLIQEFQIDIFPTVITPVRNYEISTLS